jgi:hypothetical protein
MTVAISPIHKETYKYLQRLYMGKLKEDIWSYSLVLLYTLETVFESILLQKCNV